MIEITKNTKAVIWDLDGTILDSHGIYKQLVTEIAPSFGLVAPSDEVFETNFHGSLRDSIHALFDNSMANDQLDEFVGEFLERQDKEYENVDGHIWEDALNLSEQLGKRSVLQLVVTNRDHEGRGFASPRSIVERSNLSEHISHIVCGDECRDRKPDVNVLGDFLIENAIDPSECLVIGDQIVDAQLALNLGARGVIIARNGATVPTENLSENWQESISVTDSLSNVNVSIS